jgi:hypothetical protein
LNAQQRRTVSAWAATALLLYCCLSPGSWTPVEKQTTDRVPHFDKAVHLGLFGLFAALWMRAGPSEPASRVRGRRVRVAAVALLLAVGTELAQAHPAIARDPDALDVLADVAGAFAGLAVVAPFGFRRGTEDEPPGGKRPAFDGRVPHVGVRDGSAENVP